MNIQLIHGQFSTKDAIDIVTQMVNVKIKFHESKIDNSHSEEDIKMREKRIKDLQQNLKDVREHILADSKSITMESAIEFA
ncbi:hypothetical protein BH11BAC3_BH11BAC3_40220 [soil metagenome]